MSNIPQELLEQRPVLVDDPDVKHPEMGNIGIGKPPPKYTLAVHEKICDEIRKCKPPRAAAARAGITYSTFLNWIEKGKQGDPHLWQFAEDVELAYHEAEAAAVERLQEIMDDEGEEKNPKLSLEAVKYFLERQRSEGWSKQVKTTVEGQIEQFMKRIEKALMSRPAQVMSGAQIFELVLSLYLGQSPAAQLGSKAEIALLPESTDAETEDE